MADTKLIDWGDGSGEKITVTASSFVGNKGLQIQSPENVKVTPRSKTIVLKSKTDPTKVARINVTQEKAVYTYDFTLSPSASMIGAEGGTSRVRGTLLTYRNGVQVSSETVVPTLSGSADGFSISGDVVTAENRGTVSGTVRQITVTGVYSNTFDGQVVSSTVVISQAENKIESYNYGTWVIAISANPTTIAYGGGTSTISTSCTRSKTPVYSSGATGSVGSESTTPTLSGSATGFTLSGTTVTASANSWAASRSIVVTASYSGATSKSVTITQSAAPASISLNKTTLAFSQRASSNTVQVTCNSDWNINSNAEFTIPDTLEIKYNPNTDIVELVDQPYQIIKKVQESDDYVLALVRIGATQGNTHSQGDPLNRDNYKDQKNAAGYSGRNLMYLLSKVDDKVFHRIVGRQWFRDGNATSQIQKGRKGQAQLFSAGTLISKPGVKLGIMGCSIDVPKLRLYPLEAGRWGTSSKVDTNPATGRISFENGSALGQRVFNPGLNTSYSTNSYAIVGYILYKKKSTTQYLDVHGWQEVSNFALARYLGDRDFMYKQIGDRYVLTVKFSYGEP